MTSEKIVSYLFTSDDVELANGNKIRIEKTKQEMMFESFKLPNSIGSKIVSEVADNPILLKFLFLESDSTITRGPIGNTVSYPLSLEPSYDFEKNLKERGDYKDQEKKLEKTLDRNSKEVFEVWKNVIIEWFDVLAADSEVNRVLRNRTSRIEDVSEALKRSVKDNESIKEQMKDNMQTFSEYAYDAALLVKMKQYVRMTKNAKSNADSLNNQFLKLPEQKQEIASALGKLAKHMDFTIESLCLDCWYEKNLLPFSSTISRVKNIDLIHQCPQCVGRGIIHRIDIGYPNDLYSLLMFDSSWIYEVFIGYALAKIDYIKKVYIHKKIQPYENGLVKSGIEMDVILITEDDKLILVEVTKQGDSTNILQNITRKIKNLEEANVPYDFIIYFTADKLERYYDIVPGKGRVFCLNHLAQIEKFVLEFIKPN
jgi:CRISPR/Cas system-associated exonuclease Cas4 (RecB family)